MRWGQRTLQRDEVELMRESRIVLPPNAGVAELADALDSKSSDRKVVWVRAPPPAMNSQFNVRCRLLSVRPQSIYRW